MNDEIIIKSFGQVFLDGAYQSEVFADNLEDEEKIIIYDAPTRYFVDVEERPVIYGKFPEELQQIVKKIKNDQFKNSKITKNIIEQFRSFFFKHPDFVSFMRVYIDDYSLKNANEYFVEFMKLAVKYNIYSDLDIQKIREYKFYLSDNSGVLNINLEDDGNDLDGDQEGYGINPEDSVGQKEIPGGEKETDGGREKKTRKTRRGSKRDGVQGNSKLKSSRGGQDSRQILYLTHSSKSLDKQLFKRIRAALRFDRFLKPLGDEDDEKWLQEYAKETIDLLMFKISQNSNNNILMYKSYNDRDKLDMEIVNRVEKMVLFNYQLDKKVRGVIKKYNLQFIKDVTGYNPQGWQKFFLVNQSRENVVATSRRSGKSYSSMYLAIRQFFLPNQMILFIIPTKEGFSEQPFFYAKKFIDNIKAEGYELDGTSTNAKDFKIANNEIGTKINFVSAQGSNQGARSYSANLVIIDEAAYVSDPNLYDVAYATTATVKGSIIAVSTINIGTPINRFYYKKIELEGNEDGVSLTVDLYNNPFIPDYEKKAIEKKYKDKDPLVWNCEWMAIFNTQKTQFAIDKFFVIDFEYTVINFNGISLKLKNNLKQYERFMIGLDPARDKDKSGLVVLGIKNENENGHIVSRAFVIGAGYIDYQDYMKQTQVVYSIYEYLKKTGKPVELSLDLGKGGQVLFDYYDSRGIRPFGIYSTSGKETTKKSYREYNVPKRELENLLAAMIDDGRLKGFTYLSELRNEFETYQEAEQRKADHHHDILSALMVAVYVLYARHYVSFDSDRLAKLKREQQEKTIIKEIFGGFKDNSAMLNRMNKFLY